jgi:hypothetical protein
MNKINFINTFAKIRPCSTFIQLHHYKNELGEVANYNLVFHISYHSAVKRSFSILSDYNNNYSPKSKLEVQAMDELLSGYQASLAKNHLADKHYSSVISETGEIVKGLKQHKETGALYLYGAVVHKNVITPGYSKKIGNKNPLTVIKDHLRMMTPLSKFRQFKISSDSLQKISAHKLEIVPSF